VEQLNRKNGVSTTAPRRPDAQYSELTVLQLLFGLRSIDDRVAWYPDHVIRTSPARALNALFQRQPSFVWPVL
jgi:hypothetical protein